MSFLFRKTQALHLTLQRYLFGHSRITAPTRVKNTVPHGSVRSDTSLLLKENSKIGPLRQKNQSGLSSVTFTHFGTWGLLMLGSAMR